MNTIQKEYLEAVTEWDMYIKSLEGENTEHLVNEEHEDEMITRIMETETNIIKWVIERAEAVGRYDMTIETLETIATHENEKFRDLVLRLN